MKVCAVFDIGKTNKKLFLFDEDYQIVKEEQSQFEEILDDDGFPCDDLIKLSSWLKETFESISQNPDLGGVPSGGVPSGGVPYEVVGLNISAYGASLVHLNSEGKPITPLYNYLKAFELHLGRSYIFHK